MTTRFDDFYNDAPLDVLLRQWGETVTYRAKGATTTSEITVVATEIPNDEDDRNRLWTARASELTDNGSVGDRLTDQFGIDWTVVEVDLPTGGAVELNCQAGIEEG